MYKLLLILKYLFKRRIAWVSLLAVMLCTAMVLVVISVMGGWLRMFRSSFNGMSGDVIVSARSLSGFPHYQAMIDRIERLPDVEASAPVIKTFGLVNIANQIRDGVQVIGFPLDRIASVNRFVNSLHRQASPTTRPSFALLPNVPYAQIMRGNQGVTNWPGMIVGVGVVGLRKDAQGRMEVPDYLFEAWAKLAVLGVSDDDVKFDAANKQETPYWIVDASRTQIWQYDSNTVYVPFDRLQRDLGMDERQATDAQSGEPVTIPARTTEIQIRVRPGADVNRVRDEIQKIVDDIYPEGGMSFGSRRVSVETWEQANALWLNAIEKEVVLVTFLFGVVSVVAVFLIFCIFYMIVVEKTRDIGIVKSVGATSAGVAQVFLGYGLAIGLVGAGLGFLASWLIVRNINEIHHWLGEAMGIQVWNPEVYAFDKIPNTMDPGTVTWIVGVAVVASVIGALVPAIRAARLHPVEALRWE